jgi:PIN domain
MATSLSKPWLLLVAVLLISLTLGVESPFGVWALADPKDLATSLFQVCGMMVALALPAAQFADASIDSLFALFEKAAPSSNTTDTPQFFEDHTKEYRSAFGAAWHGCICAFLSLLLASLFFVTPQEHCCPADAICFDTRGLILSTSLACLLVGTAVGPSERHWPILRHLLWGSGTAGNLTSDAHLAALAVEHGCTVCSADNDFRRFASVPFFNPLNTLAP